MGPVLKRWKAIAKKQYNKFLFIIALAIVFLLIYPYIAAIIGGMILAYILFPLYIWIRKKVGNRTFAALSIVFILLIFIITPLAIVIHKASVEANAAYGIIKGSLIEGELNCNDPGTIVCSVSDIINGISSNVHLSKLLENSYSILSDYLVRTGSGVIFSIPSIVLSIFIAMFITYYGLKEHKKITEYITKVLKIITPESTAKIHKKFKEVINGVIYGQLIIALIQGVIAGIGYFIFGIKSPIFFGLLTAIAAIIPVLGTSIVWFPASIWLLLNGLIASDNSLILKGVGLMLYGIIIISTSDNIIRPKLVSEKANIHPVVVLIGVLGGIKLFGFIGFIIGPVVLSVSLLLLNIYMREIDGIKS